METQQSLFPQNNRPLHRRVWHGIVNIAIPPLANRRHRRYAGKPHHLVFDTFLTLCILALVTMNIVLLLRVTSSDALTVTIDAPAVHDSGTTVTLTLTVKNNRANTAHDAFLVMAYPTGFVVTGSEPTAADGARTMWSLPALGKYEEFTLTVTGRLSGLENGAAVFRATTHYRMGGNALTYDAFRRVELSTKNLTTSITAAATAISGTPFAATITVKNGTSDTLENVIVELDAPTGFITDKADPLMIKDAREWVLTNLVPDEQRAFTVTGHIATAKDVQARLTAHTSIAVGADRLLQTSAYTIVAVQGQSSVEQVVTEPQTEWLTLAAEAKYFGANGAQFGYGPNPPAVGAATVYRVFWAVNVPAHLSGSATVMATVPESAIWKGNDSVTAGGGVAFDAATRTVTWTIGTVPRNQATLMASFEIGVTPIATDLSHPITLLKESAFTLKQQDGTREFRAAPAVLSPTVVPST